MCAEGFPMIVGARGRAPGSYFLVIPSGSGSVTQRPLCSFPPSGSQASGPGRSRLRNAGLLAVSPGLAPVPGEVPAKGLLLLLIQKPEGARAGEWQEPT